MGYIITSHRVLHKIMKIRSNFSLLLVEGTGGRHASLCHALVTFRSDYEFETDQYKYESSNLVCLLLIVMCCRILFRILSCRTLQDTTKSCRILHWITTRARPTK